MSAPKDTNLLEKLTGHARMTVNGLDNHQDACVSNNAAYNNHCITFCGY